MGGLSKVVEQGEHTQMENDMQGGLGHGNGRKREWSSLKYFA